MPAIVIPAPISSNHAAPVSAGGTGATTAAAARTNLDVYSKSEVTNAISQSTAYVPTTTHGLTAGTGVSLDSNQVSKLSIGKLRIYAFVFTATSSISAESPLITGFDSVRGSANGIYSCVLFNNNTRTEQKFAFMHGQSYLCCTTAIAANTTWRGNIVYMAA